MQPIKCVCPSCAAALKISHAGAGKVCCPRCGNPFTPTGITATPVVVPIPAVARHPQAARPVSNNGALLLGLAVGGAVVFLGLLVVGTVVTVSLMGGPRGVAANGGTGSSATATASGGNGSGPRQMPPPEPKVEGPDVAANLTPEQHARINAAIEKGVEFLKKDMDGKAGFDPHANRSGGVALGLLTLLSCGVPDNDPIVQKAIERVRNDVPRVNQTYDVSLCILALDRLNDPKDQELIRTLALRLIAMQNGSGGWSYSGAVGSLSEEDEDRLVSLLQQREAPGSPLAGRSNETGTRTDPDGPDRGKGRKGKRPPFRPGHFPGGGAGVENLPVVQFDPDKPLNGGGSDNSNTQFAILAVWAAQKHGVPVQQCMRMIDARFRSSQNGDGSWGYHPNSPVWPDSMTCAGLIGLAVGKGIDARKAGDKDDVIDRAVTRLSRNIGKKPAEHPDATSRRLDMESHGDLYYLWSLERVAVIYNAREIGGKEWYPWGADFLIGKQNADGGWRDHHAGLADTCFALLFLKRANVAQDLTQQIGNLNLLGRVK